VRFQLFLCAIACSTFPFTAGSQTLSEEPVSQDDVVVHEEAADPSLSETGDSAQDGDDAQEIEAVAEDARESVAANPTALLANIGGAIADIADFGGSPTEFHAPDEINSDGAFSYSVPLQLPGFRELVPNLSLAYNSTSKHYSSNGPIMGIGWSLQGLSSIERVSPGGGFPSFLGDVDIYTLDGEELLACSDDAAAAPYTGPYSDAYRTEASSPSCLAGGHFVTRRDNGLRITIGEETVEGRSSPVFTVTRPNGTQLIYRSIGALSGTSLSYDETTTEIVSNAGATQTVTETVVMSEAEQNTLFNRSFLLSEIRDAQASTVLQVEMTGMLLT